MELREKEEEVIPFKKVNIVLMVFLTILTIGIYTAYWFINRKNTLDSFSKKNYIPSKWWYAFLIYLSISFVYTFLGGFLFSEFGLAILDSIDTIITFYFVGLLYYSVFRLKEMIEAQAKEANIKSWLLVLFNLWYIQYKINSLNELRRDPREEDSYA
ncbi:DUF4234 domain-containing protein [Pontibacillus yanchengensis]|uniref:DUF4234 domain-containing protein n=1 Tax=Pontibacillus yanchengensis TaxID=462910 RepID=A0A6I4ZXI9_9BACI|nr:DUF4234 domain-containing protein [Pontibacillus yanchengensis]MYL33834.1 DUF4234 domain-containing protein [Pontibacillus yanchengensis]